MSLATDVAAIQDSIQSLQTRWAAAQAEYETQKTALAAKLDSSAAAHTTAATAHTAAAKDAATVKATIVSTADDVSAAATSAIDQFILTTPWYKKVVAWVEKEKRWLLWGIGALALYGVYRFF